MTKPVEYLHIVTVGTSLLLNNHWEHGHPLPRKQILLESLRNDPRKNSAELNALLHFIDRDECSRVHLLATDTPQGRLCGQTIGRYLHDRGIQTTDGKTIGLLSRSIELATSQVSFFTAIRVFRDAVFRVAQKARRGGAVVFINATGSIKAETAVAAMVAAELKLSAYYIHQSMNEPVFLPTAALDPDALEILRGIGKPRHVPPKLAPRDQDRLQREGLIKLSLKADGQVSSIHLTAFAKHLLKPYNP
ncbi:MAG: putative CRISPR-associated protein [Phycisphaeraceae bacterium]